uniref:Uncharacterized protein n=1 Tax=Opuntia streptacantha TaxID=393608 RepID=A0A7C9E9Z6_OPUST
MEATLRVSKITLVVYVIFLVSAHVRGLSSPRSSFPLITTSCSSVTACRTEGFSAKYLTSQVRTLAVVSLAAKMTPIMLSAICWSVRDSLSTMKEASKSWLSLLLFSLLAEIIWARIWASSFLAFIDLLKSVPGKLMGIELYPFSSM